MSFEDFKKDIEHKIEADKKMEEFKAVKSDRRVVLYMVGALTLMAAFSTLGGYFKYKRYQKERIQAEKDAKTEMTLIDLKTDITPRACTGVMFFSKTDQTNRADAVMHYATRDPDAMERIRHVKLGERRKVSEWKGIVMDQDYRYRKNYSWSELEK